MGNSTAAVGIIGGGFSGTILAINLRRRMRPGEAVFIIEKRRGVGRGLAYSTTNQNHLLNVRAGNMSAFGDRPGHFVAWLEDRWRESGGERPSGDSFVNRRLYGSYIQSLLADDSVDARSTGTLTVVPDEAVDLFEDEAGVTVIVASGIRYRFDAVVLATGNLPPDRRIGSYFGDPWDPDAVANLDPRDSVLLIGSGMTMVDVVVSLLDNGHLGPIQAVSRRGLLPHVHRHTDAVALTPDDLPRTTSLLRMLRWVRQRVDQEARAGNGWREVVDSLRPHLPELWRSLPLPERRRFLRHVRPYWDIHRHRVAPETSGILRDAMMRGQLTVRAARIQAINPGADGGGVQVAVRPRAGGTVETLSAARAINCSGPETNYEACREPLLRKLLAVGTATPDVLRLGIDVSEEGALISRHGIRSERLFALGPVTRGVYWESTAVPDIRLHAARLARYLTDDALPRVRELPGRRAVGG